MFTKGSLSAPRKRLLEIMQKTNFGRIESLQVIGGEPVFNPPPRVVKDVKLGADNDVRPEVTNPDFLLKREHIELFGSLTAIANGTIDEIEIKHGLPFKLVVEQEV